MKILQVSTYHSNGGAGIAASRLHECMRSFGIESHFIAANAKVSSDHVSVLNYNSNAKMVRRIYREVDELSVKAFRGRTDNSKFSPGFLSQLKTKSFEKYNPDIIHLHWINDGFLGLAEAKKINVPVFITLHDCWFFTGGCHYPQDCALYQNDCHPCPHTRNSNFISIASHGMQNKKKIFEDLKSVTIISPSNWMSEMAKSSKIFQNCEILTIPNPIDTEVLFPIEKNTAKLHLGLEFDFEYIIFGASAFEKDKRKGADFFIELARLNSNNPKLRFLTFGSNKREKTGNIIHLGRVHDIDQLRNLYSASTVFVSPSREENLSNMMIESLCHGTPVLAFNIGGNSDIVQHNSNGYLAKPFLLDDLEYGLNSIIARKHEARVSSRKFAESKFSYSAVGPVFSKMYERAIRGA